MAAATARAPAYARPAARPPPGRAAVGRAAMAPLRGPASAPHRMRANTVCKGDTAKKAKSKAKSKAKGKDKKSEKKLAKTEAKTKTKTKAKDKKKKKKHKNINSAEVRSMRPQERCCACEGRRC